MTMPPRGNLRLHGKGRHRRRLRVIWNVIPWWNYTRDVTGPESREGIACVKQLITLLPKLRAVVSVGKQAARAKPDLKNTKLKLLVSDHPSPLVRANFPERWKAIPVKWAKVRRFLDRQIW
jgi:Uracil DNA glycosylase superfamily